MSTLYFQNLRVLSAIHWNNTLQVASRM